MSRKSTQPVGLVSRIISFSCVDGPGNRFVIFLQGCNFQCKNCHNPHTIGRCNHCGDCVPGCPSGALKMVDDKVIWNHSLCQSCDQCVDLCPQSSSPMIHHLSVDDLIAQLETAAAFLTGVTVSGGESTLQLKFIKALFSAIKANPRLQHLTCLVDSNGYLSVSGWKKILPVMDGAMIDLKASGDELHQWLTGRSNQRVIETIHFLFQQKKLTEVRWLAIPGITDTDEEIAGIRQLLKAHAPDTDLRINAFSNKAVRGEAKHWSCLESDRIPLIRAQLQ